MIVQTNPNYMPVHEQNLDDGLIIEALFYIKSTWPKHIRDQHDLMIIYVNARKEQK